MRDGITKALAALMLVSLAACSADSKHMKYMNGETAVVDGKYREGKLIRVSASMSRNGSAAEAFNRALQKTAEMTAAKGYKRFAVVKVSDCGTLVMYGSIPVSNSCRLLAQMLGPDETAKPEGSRPVTYYSTDQFIIEPLPPAGE